LVGKAGDLQFGGIFLYTHKMLNETNWAKTKTTEQIKNKNKFKS